jgi:hypothetical protein
MTGRFLHEQGKLPPTPSGFDFDYIDRHTVIAIDPHTSIHAMVDLAKGMAKVIDAIGFEILENRTDQGFITSDNPVVYFDPTVSEGSVQPYNIDRLRMEIELLFPITPKLLLWGHTVLKEQFERRGTPYRVLVDEDFVRRVNRFIVRFANRFVFSEADHHAELVRRYANTSPIVKVSHIKTGARRGIVAQSVFGKREPKPKWTGRGI